MRLRLIKWTFLVLCGIASLQKASAQLPVEKEAHHKLVLENEWVRVFEGRVLSHDTTPPHIHAANSVVVFLSNVRFGIRTVGQQPVVADIAAGDIVYRAYGDKPVNHIVWDESDSALRFLLVELKKPVAGNCPIESRPDSKLLWRQKQVSAYEWVLTGGQPAELAATTCARMVIEPATGAFRFYPPDTPIKLQTRGILLQF